MSWVPPHTLSLLVQSLLRTYIMFFACTKGSRCFAGKQNCLLIGALCNSSLAHFSSLGGGGGGSLGSWDLLLLVAGGHWGPGILCYWGANGVLLGYYWATTGAQLPMAIPRRRGKTTHNTLKKMIKLIMKYETNEQRNHGIVGASC